MVGHWIYCTNPETRRTFVELLKKKWPYHRVKWVETIPTAEYNALVYGEQTPDTKAKIKALSDEFSEAYDSYIMVGEHLSFDDDGVVLGEIGNSEEFYSTAYLLDEDVDGDTVADYEDSFGNVFAWDRKKQTLEQFVDDLDPPYVNMDREREAPLIAKPRTPKDVKRPRTVGIPDEFSSVNVLAAVASKDTKAVEALAALVGVDPEPSVPLAENIECEFTKKVLKDPIITPCCVSFCSQAPYEEYLSANNNTCPLCHAPDITADKLLRNRGLTARVAAYHNSKDERPADAPVPADEGAHDGRD